MTDANSTVQQRKETLEAMDTIGKLVQGYTLAIGHLTGDSSRTEYYRNYFDQARSADGLVAPLEQK